MLLTTLREPPPQGSVQELVLNLFVLQRHLLDISRVRALAVAAIDAKQGVEALKDYLKAAQPWAEKHKKQEMADVRQALEEFVARGPLSVSPSFDPRSMRSQLRRKVVRREESHADWQKKTSSVMRRIGPIIPRSGS